MRSTTASTFTLLKPTSFSPDTRSLLFTSRETRPRPFCTLPSSNTSTVPPTFLRRNVDEPNHRSHRFSDRRDEHPNQRLPGNRLPSSQQVPGEGARHRRHRTEDGRVLSVCPDQPATGEPCMNGKTSKIVSRTEQEVHRLVEECRKHGPLYEQNPKVVAHVSRTSKWLLNAITKLKSEIKE